MTIKSLFGFLSLLIGALTSFAQEGYIAKWPKSKSGAVSITFDDNCVGQFTVALPKLNQENLKATYFVITEGNQCNLVDWNLVREAHSSGHEIGSHTITHRDLRTLSNSQISQELEGSYNKILSEVSSIRGKLTIAWPFGRGGGSVAKDDTIRTLALPFYFGARNAGAGPNGYLAYDEYVNPFYKDFYRQVGAVVLGPNNSAMNIGTTLINTAQAGGWLNLVYHGVETGGYNNISATLFNEHIDTIVKVQNERNLWVTTFGNTVKYHHQRRASTLSINSSAWPEWEVSIADTLSDSETYNLPLTVKIGIPDRNNSATPYDSILIEKDGLSIESLISQLGDSLEFDILPNSGSYRVFFRQATNLSNRIVSSEKLIWTYNQSNNILRLMAKGIELQSSEIKLSSMLGQEIPMGIISSHDNGFELDVSRIPKGVYFLSTSNGQVRHNCRVLIQ